MSVRETFLDRGAVQKSIGGKRLDRGAVQYRNVSAKRARQANAWKREAPPAALIW